MFPMSEVKRSVYEIFLKRGVQREEDQGEASLLELIL
jgi:hypothetical protein